MTALKTFRVGVFEHRRTSGRVFLMAYVRDFNPNWDGCCVHHVAARSGASAKDSAKSQHRRDCMPVTPHPETL